VRYGALRAISQGLAYIYITGRVCAAATVARHRLDMAGAHHYLPRLRIPGSSPQVASARVMRVRNSLRSAKVRDKNCRVVRRRGRVYVINKKNPRMKCRQG
jgi:large subunit ribosomal protein L36